MPPLQLGLWSACRQTVPVRTWRRQRRCILSARRRSGRCANTTAFGKWAQRLDDGVRLPPRDERDFEDDDRLLDLLAPLAAVLAADLATVFDPPLAAILMSADFFAGTV